LKLTHFHLFCNYNYLHSYVIDPNPGVNS